MKKLALLAAALVPAISAFAYRSNDYDDGEMSGFAIFTLIVMIAYIILSIVILVRWWNMTKDVKEIKEHLTHTHSNPKLTYLVAIGEREQADKAALVMLVDNLMPIYYSQYEHNKAESMNKYLKTILPKISKLDIKLPDYVMSGERFIDYINSITGNNIPYATN